MVKKIEMKIVSATLDALNHDCGWLEYVGIPPIEMVMTWGWFMTLEFTTFFIFCNMDMGQNLPKSIDLFPPNLV